MFGFDLKKIFSIGLLCTVSQVALCANWEYVTRDSNNKVAIYVDTDSIKKYSDGYSTSYNDNFRSAWFKFIYTKPQELYNGKTNMQSKNKNVMACHLDKAIVESAIAYDKQGNVVGEDNSVVTTTSVSRWDNIIPDTIGELMFNRVCK